MGNQDTLGSVELTSGGDRRVGLAAAYARARSATFRSRGQRDSEPHNP